MKKWMRFRWLKESVKRVGREVSVFQFKRTRLWDVNLIYAFLFGDGQKNWWWQRDPAARAWSQLRSLLNRVAFRNRESISLITGALAGRLLLLPSLSTWHVSKSCSPVSRDKWEEADGVCYVGHTASSEKICFVWVTANVGGRVGDGASYRSDSVICRWGYLVDPMSGLLRGVIASWTSVLC